MEVGPLRRAESGAGPYPMEMQVSVSNRGLPGVDVA